MDKASQIISLKESSVLNLGILGKKAIVWKVNIRKEK